MLEEAKYTSPPSSFEVFSYVDRAYSYSDEDKCIILFFSLLDLWDSLVVAIGSNTTSLNFEEVVSSLFSEEMR